VQLYAHACMHTYVRTCVINMSVYTLYVPFSSCKHSQIATHAHPQPGRQADRQAHTHTHTHARAHTRTQLRTDNHLSTIRQCPQKPPTAGRQADRQAHTHAHTHTTTYRQSPAHDQAGPTKTTNRSAPSCRRTAVHIHERGRGRAG